MNIKSALLQRPRSEKRLLLLAIDIFLIPVILWASFSFRLNGIFIAPANQWLIFPIAIFIALPIFMKLGLYRAVLKYFRSQAIITIIIATLLSTIAWVSIISLLDIISIPASVALIYWLGTFTIITLTRLVAQRWLYGDFPEKNTGKRILIYGAGVAGTQLATVLKTDSTYSIAGFVDDDENLKGWNILGLTVYSSLQLDDLIPSNSIDEVILAMPSAGITRRTSIINKLEPLPVNVRSIPAFADMASGRLQASDIRDIDIDDLLGRDAIKPNDSLLPANIKNKVVLVTGAGGSIGSELCRQIITLSPKKIILLDQSELGLYTIEQELESIWLKIGSDIQIDKVLGSITNPALLERLFKHKDIQTIYHAAAYKHVPLVEENPVAGLNNNIFGTKLLAEHASKANVGTFILISTDKAVRPTNVMGCSKRVAEMVLQALAEKAAGDTIFSMVRFGNVLGSSGSVVPKFRQQIRKGGPITVTHKEITRFFMSVPEAVQLVIQAGAMGKGGDVFVLDMGSPIKITDLAKKMINLSGLTIKDECNPEGDIEIEFTGLRPGEKLYEELLIGNNVSGTKHPRIMRANETYKQLKELEEELSSLQSSMQTERISSIKTELSNLVEGYTPWVKSKHQKISLSPKNVVKIR